tara:strand:+ start:318 stop:722 length:405 start_codon:yes stop_codon:yes gene_type:complete
MNKDLPLIIRQVFDEPDPLIWQGIWLSTLKVLLNDHRMPNVWDNLIQALTSRHTEESNLRYKQYMKWELKAFVAQVVKSLANNQTTNFNENESLIFKTYLLKYFNKKRIIVDVESIDTVYQVIVESGINLKDLS